MRVASCFFSIVFALVAGAGCGDLKEAPAAEDAGAGVDGATPPGADGGGGVSVTARVLVSGRSRLGARSSAGFRPWRTGLAVHDGRVYWVESGASPGLYSASADTPCEDPSCVEQVADLVRPSAFTATDAAVVVADATVVERIAFGSSSPAKIASSAGEDVVNLAAADATVFWTSGTDPAIRLTAGGTTSTPISSNGTPVGMAVAGDRVFWAGVDISGQLGALQSMQTSGKGAREVSRFSGGFWAMGGTTRYLYWAEDRPANVHRLTVSSGRDEIVDRDAMGVTDFAFDDAYAYWVEPGDAPDYANGRVRRVAHDGKDAETLAVSVAHPVAVAVSGDAVFVAAAGTSDKSWADGAILELTLGRAP